MEKANLGSKRPAPRGSGTRAHPLASPSDTYKNVRACAWRHFHESCSEERTYRKDGIRDGNQRANVFEPGRDGLAAFGSHRLGDGLPEQEGVA